MLVERTKRGFSGFLLMWAASAFALWVTALVVPGMSIASFGAAFGVAAVLGVLHVFVRPLLVVLTLPVTLLTLGLFLGVINAGVLALAAALLDGFALSGAFSALLGTVVLSVVSSVVSKVLASDR
jgi:putative membrane protein